MKYLLNLRKNDNYAFFCPQSRMHLTISNPVGFADRVTPAIARALKAQTIIDITEEENKTEPVAETKVEEPVEKKLEEVPIPTQQESTESKEVEAPVNEVKEEATEEPKEKPAKRGRKTTK